MSTSYAEPSDIFGTAGYLRDPSSPANTAVMQTFLSVASRLIDEMAGQFFFDDGWYTQPLDGEATSQITTPYPFFFSSGTIAAAGNGSTSLTYTPSKLAPAVPQNGDILTLDIGSLREQVTINGSVTASGSNYTIPCTTTAITHGTGAVATTITLEIAYFENQPLNQRIVTFDGDAVTPPTNFYAWPRMRQRVGAANTLSSDVNRWPWYGIDIAGIPISNTTYLPTPIPGRDTIRLGVHWGWPIVPDLIKDLTCKLAVRLWRKRQAGGGYTTGSGDAQGAGDLRELFDAADEAVLLGSGLKRTYI